VEFTAHELTIETRRLNGTDIHRLFTLSLTQFRPVTAVRFAEIVREWYALQH
jgi:hypothetical protein